MLFRTKDNLFKIMWKKEHEKYRDGNDKINTRCCIYLDRDARGWELIGVGLSKLNWLDRNNHDRYTGKKIALTRALINADYFTKEDRTKIWFEFNFLFKKSVLDPTDCILRRIQESKNKDLKNTF